MTRGDNAVAAAVRISDKHRASQRLLNVVASRALVVAIRACRAVDSRPLLSQMNFPPGA
jgi:hypothetical protein